MRLAIAPDCSGLQRSVSKPFNSADDSVKRRGGQPATARLHRFIASLSSIRQVMPTTPPAEERELTPDLPEQGATELAAQERSADASPSPAGEAADDSREEAEGDEKQPDAAESAEQDEESRKDAWQAVWSAECVPEFSFTGTADLDRRHSQSECLVLLECVVWTVFCISLADVYLQTPKRTRRPGRTPETTPPLLLSPHPPTPLLRPPRPMLRIQQRLKNPTAYQGSTPNSPG